MSILGCGYARFMHTKMAFLQQSIKWYINIYSYTTKQNKTKQNKTKQNKTKKTTRKKTTTKQLYIEVGMAWRVLVSLNLYEDTFRS